jgi:hypothetical protein
MTVFESVKNNLFVVSNNIHKGFHHFRIDAQKDGTKVIKENNFLRKGFSWVFSGSSHQQHLKNLIDKNVQDLSQLERECFIDKPSAEITELFIAAQKYNQTV